jgi:hypothetical protein
MQKQKQVRHILALALSTAASWTALSTPRTEVCLKQSCMEHSANIPCSILVPTRPTTTAGTWGPFVTTQTLSHKKRHSSLSCPRPGDSIVVQPALLSLGLADSSSRASLRRCTRRS